MTKRRTNAINQAIYYARSDKKPSPELLALDKWSHRNCHYKFLNELCRRYRPKLVVELGTANGTSARYMKAGYEKAELITIDLKQPEGEKLASFDIRPVEANVMDENTPDTLLPGKNVIDILYIDINCYAGKGKTRKQPSFFEIFQKWQPYMKKRSIVVVDDIRYLPESKIEWRKFHGDKIDLSDMHPFGGFGVILHDGE